MGIKSLALASALLAALPAYADPAKATHWVGLAETADGFLIDTGTGAAWMTGSCLVPLKSALKTGDEWVVRQAELVSAGRALAMLDQTFGLNLDPANPGFWVSNPVRGGRQDFDGALKTCAAGDCRTLAAQPVCEN